LTKEKKVKVEVDEETYKLIKGEKTWRDQLWKRQIQGASSQKGMEGLQKETLSLFLDFFENFSSLLYGSFGFLAIIVSDQRGQVT